MATRTQHRTAPSRGLEHARSCVGCGVRAERPKGSFELVRFALLPVGESPVGPEVESAPKAVLTPVLDLAGGTFGRGAWVHPTRRCLDEAVKRGFARAAKAEVSSSFDAIATAIEEKASKRVFELIAVGVRSRKVAFGTTAVAEANSKLTLVAIDAAAQREVDVAKALASGKALAFGTKRSLGDACGRDVVGMVAITDESLATAVRDAVALSLAAATTRGL